MAKLDLRENPNSTGGFKEKFNRSDNLSIIAFRPDTYLPDHFRISRRFHFEYTNQPPLPQQVDTPQNLTVTSIQETEVSLDWDDNTDSPDSYTVYVQNNTSSTIEQTITGITLSEADVMGLTTGDEYEFWVTAVKGSNESAQSNHITATPADTTAPATPTGLQEDAVDTNSVDISWDANGEDDISLYHIYVEGVEHSNSPVSHPTTSFTVDGLDPDNEYDITISAEDDAGNESAQTGAITSTTLSESVTMDSSSITMDSTEVTMDQT